MKPYELTEKYMEARTRGCALRLKPYSVITIDPHPTLNTPCLEDIVTYEAQKKLLEYLNEPCHKHYDKYNTQSHTKNLMLGYYHKHRRDCRDCMQALLKDFGIK